MILLKGLFCICKLKKLKRKFKKILIDNFDKKDRVISNRVLILFVK